jgi:hypothetical protein
MKPTVQENREVIMVNAKSTQNENDVEIIQIAVPERYSDFNKKIVFLTNDGTVWDFIEEDNTYKLKHAITKNRQVDFYIWLTKDEKDFRSVTKTLKFNHNKDANEEITDDEVSGYNRMINILENEITTVTRLEANILSAITQVNNLDLDANKENKITTVQLTKKDGQVKTIQIADGISLQFMWRGTSLGIKTEEQEEYTFVDLQGIQGQKRRARRAIYS